MNIGEKVAYLKGLAEGIEISSDTKEGKLLKGILDVLADVSGALKKAEETQEELSAYAEELDEDLGALEKAFIKRGAFGFDGDGLDYLDIEDADLYGGYADSEGSAKIACPDCGGVILFDLDDIKDNGAVDCPECDAQISVVGEYSSEERGCGGCAGHLHAEQDNNGE